MDYVFEGFASAVGLNPKSLVVQVALFYVILALGGVLFYLIFASLSYTYFFKLREDTFFPKTICPQDVAKQARHEIWIACSSIPFMAVAMLPAPVFAYRGYSKLYKRMDEHGLTYTLMSVVAFFLFTDCLIYWFHRGLHHPVLYKRLHKLHHTYRYTTPFSSHAFHPLDGFGQGVPYYIFAYLVPMHHVLFLCMFVFVNFWTISIHDQVDLGGSILNTTGHHTIHHEQFNFNYGQYFTIWDRIGGTYRPAMKTHSSVY